MTELSINKGLFFEDFEVGHKATTASRTITEHDIVAFAGLSGDFNLIHVDAEYAKSTPIGQRIAHGLLGMSIASGLAVQTGILGANVIVFREVGEWKFVKPIFIGDTIHVDIEVTETKAFPRLGGGLVTMSIAVQNQANETTMKGLWTLLIKFRS